MISALQVLRNDGIIIGSGRTEKYAGARTLGAKKSHMAVLTTEVRVGNRYWWKQ